MPSPASSGPERSPAVRTTTDYVVSGMTCAHCVQAVRAEVSDLDGVDAVTVDLDSGRLSVTSSAEVPYAAVAAAVDEAGYTLSPA